MVKVTDKDFYMDGYLQNMLDVMKKKIKEDFDFVIVVDGFEGSGKSVLAQQIGYYLDHTLTLDKVVFRADPFKKAVLKAERYKVVIFDEAFGGLSSRQFFSQTNKALNDMLSEIRQKNLFIIIVLPTIFDLDRYVSLWRSVCLVHVYLTDNLERGRFLFFNQSRKKTLLVEGKKGYNYSVVKSNFHGRFTNHYVVNEASYRKKKLEALRATDNTINSPIFEKHIKQRNLLINHLNNECDYSHKKIGEIAGLSRQSVTIIIKSNKNL